MKKAIASAMFFICMLTTGTASAVPCAFAGVTPSDQCRDGITGQDSADVLNTNAYFGASNWQFLDRIDTHSDLGDSAFWTVVGAHRGLPSGNFTLADGIWSAYSKLAVALKGPGAVGTPGSPTVNWALYELVPGSSSYEWQYGIGSNGKVRNLLWITLYGIAASPTSIAEPGTASLLFPGLLLIAFAIAKGRRKVMA